MQFALMPQRTSCTLQTIGRRGLRGKRRIDRPPSSRCLPRTGFGRRSTTTLPPQVDRAGQTVGWLASPIPKKSDPLSGRVSQPGVAALELWWVGSTIHSLMQSTWLYRGAQSTRQNLGLECPLRRASFSMRWCSEVKYIILRSNTSRLVELRTVMAFQCRKQKSAAREDCASITTRHPLGAAQNGASR